MSNSTLTTHDRANRALGICILAVVLGSIIIVVAVTSLLINAFSQLPPAETVQPPAVETHYSQPATESIPGTLALINDFRATQELPALALSADLNASAQAKADDLVSFDYWSHYRGDVSPWTFIRATGYDYARAGENLAKCYSGPVEFVQAWIDSPTHRAVLVGDYKEVGFGLTHDNNENCDYVVGHFASRKAGDAPLPVTGVAG